MNPKSREVVMSHTDSILIVDDDPRFCDSLKVLLSNQGYQIQTSNSGKEAMEYLVKNNFDLALLDIVMPEMDGHQIMDYINSKSPQTLVIVITGHASMESAIESLRRGAYDYLRKPFESEELFTTVENALNKKRLERENKTIQGKLALTEKRYQYLVDNSPDIIYILNHEGRFTFVNDAIEALLGFEANQLVGNHYTSIVFEEDIDKAKYHFNERRTGKRVTVSTELRLKFYHNGDELKPSERKHLAVELKAMGMYDRPADSKDKKFTGTYGVGRDISARRQAEEALRNSEEKYRSLVESTEDSIYLVDRDCSYLFMNQKHLSRFGLPPHKVIGRPYAEFHSKQETREFKNKVNEVFETGKSLWHEYRSQRDGGYFLRTLTPVKEPDGRITAATVVSKGITERKQAEETLREAEERYQAIFEQAADSIMLVDGDTGDLVEFNERAHQHLGYTREEFEKLKVSDFEVIESAEDVAEHIKKIIKEGHDTFETKHRTKGGETRDIQVTSRAISIREKNYVQSMWRDITEHKRAEEELQRSREELRNLADHLQSVREQERTTIAREIHDDLGQTLTALKMDISWLGKKLPKDQETLLEKTKAMTKLTDMTIKTVKKISTELRPGLLDDLGLVAAIEWQTEEFENRTGIRCELTVDPEEIILDQDRSTAIFRIFQETLTNIARHAKATRVTISLKEKDDKVELRVRDNGKGITKEQISDSKSFGLMGIRERVHLLGGKVKITGKPGEGTTVVVSIPIETR
jgi:PAS domain S-box-containing protein